MATVSDVLPPVERPATALGDVRAAVTTAIGCVLLGAPVGLLWTALAPRLRLVVSGESLDVVERSARDYMTSDVWFLVLVAAAGVLTAAVALTAERRHGVGTVLGLAVGGLLAAEVARRTGPLIALEDARALVASGQDGAVDLPARLRSTPAVAVWPLVAVVLHLVVSAGRR